MTTNSDRVNAWRQRHRLEGARQITIMLPAKGCEALEAIKADDRKVGNTNVIAAALVYLARARGLL